MLLLHLFALFILPFCLAAPKDPQSIHDELVKLANANNGLIKLDEHSYDMLTNPKRNWSAAVQLTATDPRRRCAPCKSAYLTFINTSIS